MREREFFVHRADIDDFSGAPCLPEVMHNCLRCKKHALQVDIQNGVEILFRYIPEVRPFLETRVVDEDVDPSKSRDGLLDEPLAVGDLSDVSLKSGGAPFPGGDSVHYFVCSFLVFPIADCDVGAFLCQTLRDRTPDPLITARYSRYFAG
jgi:hypothetical protein